VTDLERKRVVCRPLRPRVPDTELGLVYDSANRSRLVQAFVSVTEDILLKQRSPRPSSSSNASCGEPGRRGPLTSARGEG
jgi:hypothetical protein